MEGSQLQQIMDTKAEEFNNIALDLARNIASLRPYSMLGQNIDRIVKFGKTPAYKYKFIEVFIIKALQYKDQIDAGDDAYFLQKDYTHEVNADLNNIQSLCQQNNISVDSDTIFQKVFEFKEFWHTLNDSNKNAIKAYMRVLAQLAQDYFEAWDVLSQMS